MRRRVFDKYLLVRRRGAVDLPEIDYHMVTEERLFATVPESMFTALCRKLRRNTIAKIPTVCECSEKKTA